VIRCLRVASLDSLTNNLLSQLKANATLQFWEKSKSQMIRLFWEKKVPKKVLIELALVEECAKKANQEIINEIFAELFNGEILIPWCKQVTKVAIIDN
jgi:predicted nucleic-acid-binding protein